MTLKQTCNCGQRVAYEHQMGGQTVQCPVCEGTLTLRKRRWTQTTLDGGLVFKLSMVISAAAYFGGLALSDSGTVTGIAGLYFLFCLYFLPALHAKTSNHPNTTAITLVNLFFGWTLIGWVVALVMSAWRTQRKVSA